MDVCPKCGLVRDLCVCESIAREEQRIEVVAVKRKFGKIITEIRGIDPKEIDLKDVAKTLKSKLACGGTVKNGTIELQGDHRTKAREILSSLGFAPQSIKTI